jgi:hypothetical protein
MTIDGNIPVEIERDGELVELALDYTLRGECLDLVSIEPDVELTGVELDRIHAACWADAAEQAEDAAEARAEAIREARWED